jgi:hypothetical protein
MATTVQLLGALLLAALVGLTWRLPRRFGLFGLFGVQILVAAGCYALGVVSMTTGVWAHDDSFVFVGLLFQAVLLNFLLLPIALVALWRRGRALTSPNRLQFESLRDPAESADGILGPPTPLLRPAVMGLPV